MQELRAFVAVVEEGGLSAAARRLHVSQSALSQTVSGLERQLGVKLLVRTSAGVRATDAGTTPLGEARAVLARHDQALRAMARHTGPGGGALRIGNRWSCRPVCSIRHWRSWPRHIRTPGCRPGHLSTSEQLAALHAGELDAGLLRSAMAGAGSATR